MKALPVLLFAVATPILAGCNDASPPQNPPTLPEEKPPTDPMNPTTPPIPPA